MPIRVSCPECDTDFEVADVLAGKRVRCMKCRTWFVVADEEVPTLEEVADEQDDDEAPPRQVKKRRREEHDEDDRPQRRRRPSRGAAQGKSGVLLAVLGGAAVVMGSCCVGAWFFLMPVLVAYPVVLSNARVSGGGAFMNASVDYEFRDRSGRRGPHYVLVIKSAQGNQYEATFLIHGPGNRGTLRANGLTMRGNDRGPFSLYLEAGMGGAMGRRETVSNTVSTGP